jgi:4-carboxymuconolactone decarboxylase
MARLKIPERAELPPAGQEAFDYIWASRGHLGGPFTVAVHSPDLGKRLTDLGAYIRFESGLPKSLRTICVMTVARTFDCRFEWAGWTKQAREAGVKEEVITAIRERRPLDDVLSADEKLAVSFGAQLMGPKHRVDDATYKAAVERFGLKHTIDMAATFGYFTMLTFILNGFEVDVPEGEDVLPV